MTEERPTDQNEATERFEISVVPDNTIVSKRIYANFVAVNQSAHDFSLRFCDAPPVHDIKKVMDNAGVHPAPVIAEIALPLAVIPALIKALQTQYNKRGEAVQEKSNEEDSE